MEMDWELAVLIVLQELIPTQLELLNVHYVLQVHTHNLACTDSLGTYSDEGADQCTPCGYGTASNINGTQYSCPACPFSYFMNRTGMCTPTYLLNCLL